MIARVLNYLYGYERLRHRGDRLFLAGEFDRARYEYTRARSVLSERDYRFSTIDALIRECDIQSGQRGQTFDVPSPGLERESVRRRPALPSSSGDDAAPYHSGLDDLFELAIAEKDDVRIEAYRSLNDDFKAGYVALVQGNADRAVRFLESAAAAVTSSFVAHMELGRAESLAGNMEAAREALKRADRTAGSDREVGILLSAVNIELGRYEEARERLVALEKRAEADPNVTFLLGRALAGMKRHDEALDKFRETVNIEPNFHEAFFEAALLLGASDRDAQFNLLNRACALAPDEVRYNRALAALVLAEPFDEEAGLAACDRLMVTDPDNAWEYLYWIARLYIRRGWKREARDPLEKSLRLVPPDRSIERREIESFLAGIS